MYKKILVTRTAKKWNLKKVFNYRMALVWRYNNNSIASKKYYKSPEDNSNRNI